MFKSFKYLLALVGVLSVLLMGPGGVYAATSPFSQTDWSGGSGQSAFTDPTKYDSGTNINHSTSGEISIAQTSGWYNNSWSYRKKITFDNSAQAENLTDFPVLVKLTTSNTDYSKLKAAGADIRFTDSNGTSSLSYEIESWNASGDSFVWVKVPQIDASSNADSIYMYYGNSSASDAQDVGNVWNSNFAMVQHLKETAACSTVFSDSTLNDNDLGCSGTPTFTTGQIDGARAFDGSQFLAGADSPKFTTPQLTVSIWANQIALSTNKALISKWFYSNQGSWAVQTNNNDDTRLRIFIADSLTDFGDNNANTDLGSWSTGWHKVTFTYDSTGIGNNGRLKVYIDGVLQNLTFTGTIPGSIQDSDTFIRVGEFGNLNRQWNGSLDEVKISNNVQSAAWIAADYKSEANTFNTFASEESQYPSSGSLTSSIFDTEGTATWGNLTFSATTPANTTATVKVRTSDSSSMAGATAFSSCTAISSGSDISGNSCVADLQRYIQYQVNFTSTDPVVTPSFQDISIAFSVPAPSPSSSSAPSEPVVYHPPSSTEVPSCGLTGPSAPGINKHLASETSVDIFFNKPEGTVTEYVISYGYDKDADNFGGTYGAGSDSEVKQTIKGLSSGTAYYFKVRGGNGCAAGAWSEAVKISTTGARSQNLVLPKTEETVSISKPVQKITQANPTPFSTALASAAPDAVAVIPTKPNAPNFSFFIPKISLEPLTAFGAALQNLGMSVTTQIASIFGGVFNSEPLMISEVKVADKGRNYAVITWKTNIPATSKVNYGDSYDYGRDLQSMEEVTEHKVVIVGLEFGKTYYYEVMSQNGPSYSFDARHEFKLE